MKFIKVTAQFETDNISLAEELICHIFFSFNLKGVVCDVPLDEPDEGFGTHTLKPPDICSVTGFFPNLDSSKIIIKHLQTQLGLLTEQDIKVQVLIDTVDEEDWADAWKAYFDVTPITDRIIVKPDWKPYTPKKNDIILHLDPGMAFGTGTHPTTAMCIQLIEKYLTPGSSFLDIGTGSGILMIAARKLGAASLLGIDTDELAIEITRQNLEKNNINPSVYTLDCTTLDHTNNTTYDLIAANIIAQVIADIAPQIASRMTQRSTAVVSGIIMERKPDVLNAFDACNLRVIQEKTSDEWVALAVKKNQ